VLFNLKKKRDQKREQGDQRDQGPKREHPKNLPIGNAAPFLLSSTKKLTSLSMSLLFSTGALRRTDGIVGGGGQSCQC
jgi:hypothetical protein